MTYPDIYRRGRNRARSMSRREEHDLVRERDRETELRRASEQELAQERRLYCDQPEDRLWHASDQTWWRRDERGHLVRADPPAHVAALEDEIARLREQRDAELAEKTP